MNKLLKQITAMLLAFVLLLTSGGALSTVNAAEADDRYVYFEYADGTVSDHITAGDTFTLKLTDKGFFRLNGDSGAHWNGAINMDTGEFIPIKTKTSNCEVNAANWSYRIKFSVKIVADTDALEEAISVADDMVQQDNYTEESWNAMQNALSNAKSVLGTAENDGLVQSTFDNATATLNNAILVLKKADLETAIKDTEELNADDYKEESWKVLQEAVVKAKALQEKEDVTVEEIETAIDEVYTAYNELELKITEKWEELNKSVEKAEAIKNDNYTEESWNALQTAIKNAKGLITTEEDVKIETVENAIKAVEEAVKGLKAKPAAVPTVPATTKKNETVKYTVAKTTLKKAKKSGKKAQLTWKKVKAATGYEVYQATKKNGKYKKVKTIKKNKVVTCKTKSLKKKTYFFKVRTYRKVAGKTYYGAFSNVKKVVVK